MPRSSRRKTQNRPPLTIAQVLSWSDDWFADHGRWPNVNSGLIPGTIDDTGARIDDSLLKGYRGLPKRPKLSVARLLERRRGVRNSEHPPRLSIGRVIKWAGQHRKRTGNWPTLKGGAIHDAPGETWNAVDLALRKGRRGLRGGSSLARLVARRCGVRNPRDVRRLTIAKILRWAKQDSEIGTLQRDSDRAWRSWMRLCGNCERGKLPSRNVSRWEGL